MNGSLEYLPQGPPYFSHCPSLFSTAGNIPALLASPWLYQFLTVNVLEFIPFHSFVGRHPQGDTVEAKRGFCFSCRMSSLCSLVVGTISLCGQSCQPLHYPGVSPGWTPGRGDLRLPWLHFFTRGTWHTQGTEQTCLQQTLALRWDDAILQAQCQLWAEGAFLKEGSGQGASRWPQAPPALS